MFKVTRFDDKEIGVNKAHVKWLEPNADGQTVIHLTHNKGEVCQLIVKEDVDEVLKRMKVAK